MHNPRLRPRVPITPSQSLQVRNESTLLPTMALPVTARQRPTWLVGPRVSFPARLGPSLMACRAEGASLLVPFKPLPASKLPGS